MYVKGEGVARDYAEAFRWEEKAAKQGDPYAQYGLSILYAKGEGVRQDYNEAFNWLRKAAEQGVPLHFDFESGWTMGYYAAVGHDNQYGIAEFIREGDDINNWKELLTIQNFPPVRLSPEDAINNLKAIREKECPGVTKWNVIAKDENSILYEWQAKPCRGWPDQHEIARIINGKASTFFLHYVLKMYQMPDEQRAKWINKFSDAK